MGVFLLALAPAACDPPCAVPISNFFTEMAGVGGTIDLASDDVTASNGIAVDSPHRQGCLRRLRRLGLSIADMLDTAASRVEGVIYSLLHAPISEDVLIKAGIALAFGLVLSLCVRGR